VSAPLKPGLDPRIAARLKRDPDGLVPAVVQQFDTGDVLMVAWMNDDALHRTLTTGEATYWSRSRRSIWIKGETSGHRQAVRSVALDCDGDTLLVRVDQTGPACHTGNPTCFADVLLPDAAASAGGPGSGVSGEAAAGADVAGGAASGEDRVA
jgi:phosphoribosyl-AMP cyclohydrolase